MSSKRRIILASTSSSRRKLMEQIGLPFSVEASNFDESSVPAMPPAELVRFLSQGKARAVAQNHSDAIVIGADLVAVLDSTILGKPHNKTDARTMLYTLSGKTHTSISGLTIIDTELGKELTETTETLVTFRTLTDEEIEGYLSTDEPMNCAGAYAIQGRGGTLIEKIEGEHTSVMGLPLGKLTKMLQEFGINVLAEHRERIKF